MLSLHYHELMGKIGEHEEKKYLVDDYMLDKVLKKHRVKEIIGVEKFDNTKTLIDTDDELPDDITLKYVVISMACIIKDENKFYP